MKLEAKSINFIRNKLGIICTKNGGCYFDQAELMYLLYPNPRAALAWLKTQKMNYYALARFFELEL